MTTPKQTQSAPGDPPKALLKALRALLRPLVKMLISFQITFPVLVEILKSVYVEVAENDFPLPEKKQTDTRISLLTGVHRKDTKRLRQVSLTQETSPETVSVGAQMVGRWISDQDYLDDQGKPIALALKAEGQKASFEALVQSVCKQDMRSRVVLDEWIRLGVATLSADNKVILNVSAFVPHEGLEEKAFFLGMNIADHIAAIDNNLHGRDPVIERCVYYNGLSDASVKLLKAEAEDKGMAALTALNAKARALRETDQAGAEPTTNHNRINFGVYFHHEPQALKEDTPKDSG